MKMEVRKEEVARESPEEKTLKSRGHEEMSGYESDGYKDGENAEMNGVTRADDDSGGSQAMSLQLSSPLLE